MNFSYDKVMVALDHSNSAKARVLVDELGSRIQWYKIGMTLFAKTGHEMINYLHDKDKRIFLDLKLHDIPTVVGKAVREIADLGVEFLTVHCMGGRAMLQAAASQCRQSNLKLLGVTLLTSHETQDSSELGWDMDQNAVIKKMMSLALEARLSGVICSPQELSFLKENTLPGFSLVTPGIRVPGQEVYADDQKRFATARQALEWGADYIVIGRPITESREPNRTLDQLFDL